jgi:hypothetical protein
MQMVTEPIAGLIQSLRAYWRSSGDRYTQFVA